MRLLSSKAYHVLLILLMCCVANLSFAQEPVAPPPGGGGDDGGDGGNGSTCERPEDPNPTNYGVTYSSSCSSHAFIYAYYPSPPKQGVSWYWTYENNSQSIPMRANVYKSGTYYLRAKDDCGKKSYGYKTLNVTITKPSAPPVPEPTGNQCGDVFLSMPTSAPSNIEWHWQGQNEDGERNNNVENGDYRVTQSGTYYVQSVKNGCWGPSTGISVSIGEKAGAPVVTIDGGAPGIQICGTGSVTFDLVNNNVDKQFEKFEMRLNGGSIQQVATPYSKYLSTAGEYNFEFRIINEHGTYCNSDWVNGYVSVIAPISPGQIKSKGDEPGDQFLCEGEFPEDITNVSMATGGNGEFTYKWKISYNGGGYVDAPQNGTHYPNDDPTGYNFFEPITESIAIKRVAYSESCAGNASFGPSNAIHINISQLEPGKIESPVIEPICYDTAPGEIIETTPAAGGNQSFIHKWYAKSSVDNDWIYKGVGTEYTPGKLKFPTTFKRVVTSCSKSKESTVFIDVKPEVIKPELDQVTYVTCIGQDEVVELVNFDDRYYYQWTRDGQNVSNGSSLNISPSSLGVGEYDYSIVASYDNCSSEIFNFHVSVKPLPTTPSPRTLTYCLSEEVILTTNDIPEGGSVEWYNSGSLISSESSVNLGVLPYGQHDYSVKLISAEGCESPGSGLVTVDVNDNGCDDNLNWVYSEQLDEYGNKIGATKQYFDFAGQPLQSQSKSFAENKIMASTGIRDIYDRNVISSMSAPLNQSDFSYKHTFVSSDGDKYDYTHFSIDEKHDNPDPIDTNEPGTLGWYYSENNTWEENVPTTAYPYSRKEFYTDGSGEVRRAAAPGEVLRLGSGHETWSGTFGVSNELQEYFQLRAEVFPGLSQPSDLKGEAIVSVGRDRNGRFSLSVSDRSENVLMTAIPGNELVLTHTKSNIFGENLSNFIYFYLLDDASIGLTGGSGYTVRNTITDADLGQPSSLSAGFYRVEGLGDVSTLSYDISYGDISYNFYDNAGRLVCSISPNGVKQWRNGISYDLIDKTTYKYNHQGWLLSTTEPDAGTTEYLYRKDGSIKYSQNAKQKLNNTFSYTDYDKLGRPVESGEVYFVPDDPNSIDIGDLEAISFEQLDANQYESIDSYRSSITKNTGFSAEKRNWVVTGYDARYFGGVPNLSRAQDFVMGAVSWTNNEHITTWYSYDEQGRVAWMAQKPTNLDRTFLVEYDYDFLGNVLQVAYESYDAGGISEAFYHYYTYDADKRLESVYTSLNGEISYADLATNEEAQLQAHYEYYLHGPLKRIELGGDLQGIDFVYNINGWLKQINNPEDTEDEAGFMNDAFGLLLNYYNNDMSSLFQVSSLNPAPKPNLFHGLPMDITNSSTIDIAQMMELYKPFVPQPSQELKEHSAENPAYKEKLMKLKESTDRG